MEQNKEIKEKVILIKVTFPNNEIKIEHFSNKMAIPEILGCLKLVEQEILEQLNKKV